MSTNKRKGPMPLVPAKAGTTLGCLQLSDLERQLLAHFRAMTDEAQASLVGMAGGVARGSPRDRARLTLVAPTKRSH